MLSLGIMLAVGVVLFVFIATDVTRGTALTLADIRVTRWIQAWAHPNFTAAMLLITELGSTLFVSSVAFIAALYALWRRQWLRLLAIVLIVYGGMLLNVALKRLFQRARPILDEPILSLASYSFPSGHTVAATVLWGMIAVFALRTLHAWHWRLLAVSSAVTIIVLVGFSRIYLGAHYLSDVLAGIAEGLVWLLFCLVLLKIFRRRVV